MKLSSMTLPLTLTLFDNKLLCIFFSWYHGTLSRVEAESLLRDAEEGAFLVRNSESAKHDYSLSLK